MLAFEAGVTFFYPQYGRRVLWLLSFDRRRFALSGFGKSGFSKIGFGESGFAEDKFAIGGIEHFSRRHGADNVVVVVVLIKRGQEYVVIIVTMVTIVTCMIFNGDWF